MAGLGTASDRSAPAESPTTPSPTTDGPVDMASLEAAQDAKRRLLDLAAAAAGGLLADEPDGAVPMGPADAAALVHRFFAGEPAAEEIGRAHV